MLLEHGGQEFLIAGQKSGLLHAIDPATGILKWKVRIADGGAESGIRYGMAARDGVLYVPSANRSGARAEDAGSQPGIVAISVEDGSLLWWMSGSELCGGRESCDETMLAPPAATEEVIFAASLDGVLYALDRHSGERLWSFDTARDFTTLTGRSTRGGGIAGTAGPMYANGRLFVSSGYGQAQRPGNALIVLAPEQPLRGPE